MTYEEIKEAKRYAHDIFSKDLTLAGGQRYLVNKAEQHLSAAMKAIADKCLEDDAKHFQPKKREVFFVIGILGHDEDDTELTEVVEVFDSREKGLAFAKGNSDYFGCRVVTWEVK